MKGTARNTLAAALILGGAACIPSRNQPVATAAPTAASEWPRTFAQATTEARESRLPAAERALTDFAARFPGSTEAAEVPYWRAVLKLDPANPGASHEALLILDAYLADTAARQHRTEAATLRRLQAALESRAAALAAIPPAPVAKQEDRAKDDEIQRLRDELARANAELARIKRRLARPK